jgi:hypothetical protein
MKRRKLSRSRIARRSSSGGLIWISAAPGDVSYEFDRQNDILTYASSTTKDGTATIIIGSGSVQTRGSSDGIREVLNTETALPKDCTPKIPRPAQGWIPPPVE